MGSKGRPSKDLLTEIFYSGIKAVDPYECVLPEAKRVKSAFQKERYRRLYAAAFGKAAIPMARALAEIVDPDMVFHGIAVTKYGHSGPDAMPDNIDVFEAGHPIPDENGVAATSGSGQASRKGLTSQPSWFALYQGAALHFLCRRGRNNPSRKTGRNRLTLAGRCRHH